MRGVSSTVTEFPRMTPAAPTREASSSADTTMRNGLPLNAGLRHDDVGVDNAVDDTNRELCEEVFVAADGCGLLAVVAVAEYGRAFGRSVEYLDERLAVEVGHGVSTVVGYLSGELVALSGHGSCLAGGIVEVDAECGERESTAGSPQ